MVSDECVHLELVGRGPQLASNAYETVLDVWMGKNYKIATFWRERKSQEWFVTINSRITLDELDKIHQLSKQVKDD